jgi:hypothetical protein
MSNTTCSIHSSNIIMTPRNNNLKHELSTKTCRQLYSLIPSIELLTCSEKQFSIPRFFFHHHKVFITSFRETVTSTMLCTTIDSVTHVLTPVYASLFTRSTTHPWPFTKEKVIYFRPYRIPHIAVVEWIDTCLSSWNIKYICENYIKL